MFDKVIESYKKLDISNKRDVNICEIKEMIAIIEHLCVENNIEYRTIRSREIVDLEKDDVSEHDYLEAQFIYIKYLKEVIGALLDEKF